jgi:anti-sigma factor ChrR (cupin superfamily)
MRVPLSVDPAALRQLPWRDTQVRGVRWLPLHLEQVAGVSGALRPGATVLLWMEPGAGYAAHRHVGCEDVLVLSGGYRDPMGTHGSGDHVHYPAGSVHAPVAVGDPERPSGPDNPPCVLFAVAPEGIELVERAPPRTSGGGAILEGDWAEALDVDSEI